MSTEAQRKATAEHRKRRNQQGWKQKAFLMPPDVVEALSRQAKVAGVSEAQHVFALVRTAEGGTVKAEAPKRAPASKPAPKPKLDLSGVMVHPSLKG